MEPPKIQVVVRKRPLTSRERMQSQADIVEVVPPDSLMVKEEK